MTRYVFWYFGSPVFYLTGQELGPQPPRHAALIEGTGALFVLACVALGLRTAWSAWRMRGHMPSAAAPSARQAGGCCWDCRKR